MGLGSSRITATYAHASRVSRAGLVALFGAACGPGAMGYYGLTPAGTQVEYTPLNASPRALKPRIPDRVEMFAAAAPGRPFVEVGLLEVRNAQYLPGESEELQGRLRIEAGYRGCDGLLLTGGSEGPMNLTGRAHRSYRASCIVFRGPPPRTAPVLRADDDPAPDDEVDDVDDLQMRSVEQ